MAKLKKVNLSVQKRDKKKYQNVTTFEIQNCVLLLKHLVNIFEKLFEQFI
jgi:hypothetical protein